MAKMSGCRPVRRGFESLIDRERRLLLIHRTLFEGKHRIRLLGVGQRLYPPDLGSGFLTDNRQFESDHLDNFGI